MRFLRTYVLPKRLVLSHCKSPVSQELSSLFSTPLNALRRLSAISQRFPISHGRCYLAWMSERWRKMGICDMKERLTRNLKTPTWNLKKENHLHTTNIYKPIRILYESICLYWETVVPFPRSTHRTSPASLDQKIRSFNFQLTSWLKSWDASLLRISKRKL